MKFPSPNRTRGVPVVPPVFTADERPYFCGNGCSGLLKAGFNFSADSCPAGRRIGIPG